MKRIIIAALACLLCACAAKPTQVSAIDNVYVNRLNARLAQYNQNAADLDASLKERLNTPVETTSAGNGPSPDEFFRDVMRSGELHARAAILGRFMREAAVSGQIGLMNSWVQNQAADLTRFSKETDDKITQLQNDAAARPNDPQLMGRAYNLLTERGSEQGAAEELLAIGNDVQGYTRDYAGAAAIDRQRAEDAQRLLEAYLSAPRVQVQAPSYVPQPPRVTNCQSLVPGMVNCISQ